MKLIQQSNGKSAFVLSGRYHPWRFGKFGYRGHGPSRNDRATSGHLSNQDPSIESLIQISSAQLVHYHSETEAMDEGANMVYCDDYAAFLMIWMGRMRSRRSCVIVKLLEHGPVCVPPKVSKLIIEVLGPTGTQDGTFAYVVS
jgi:hypothetical protein